MPFRSATALVTVEREGVLRSFVTELSGTRAGREGADRARRRAERVRVGARGARPPAREALLVRSSRSEPREVTALVDLDKPAYRLGTAEIRVGWQPHRLDVRVAAGPRDAMRSARRRRSSIAVARADGKPLPAGAEVALAAVDEALLELAPNRSWDLLEAMMGRRGLEVWTSTAQLQVVGKRHYGRKAVPHGGGGGRERARESFDTLLLWQGARDARSPTARAQRRDSAQRFADVVPDRRGRARRRRALRHRQRERSRPEPGPDPALGAAARSCARATASRRRSPCATRRAPRCRSR